MTWGVAAQKQQQQHVCFDLSQGVQEKPKQSVKPQSLNRFK